MGIPVYQLYGEKSGNAGDYFLHCETIAARSAGHAWRIKPHRHKRFLQFLYISNGESRTFANNETFRQAAGTAIVIPAGEVHGFSFSQDIDGHVLTVLADRAASLFPEDARIAGWFDRVQVVDFATDHGDRAYLEDSVRRFAAEYADRRQDRDLCLDIGFRHLLMQVYRRGLANSGIAGPDSNLADERLALVMTLINTNYRRHLPVSFYAAEAGLSPTHLIRLCRESFGRPVSALISERVIQEAKRYLLFSQRSVQEIAYELGFSDPCYFSRYFARVAGRPPQQFRREQHPDAA
jgi:AraC family transcriptional activator of pobA